MADNEKITIFADDFFDQKRVKEDIIQFIVFRLNEEWYGIDITMTLEVIKVDRITFIPSSPSYIKGIVNVRGNILPVTDLKNLFGLGFMEEAIGKRLVVVEKDDVQIGFLVDDVEEVVDILVEEIDPILATIPPKKAEYLSGQKQVGDKIIGLLKVESFFEDCKS